MIILRQNNYSLLRLFNGKNKKHKEELENIIKTKFSWAIEYLNNLDNKLNKENAKLEELSKKLFDEGYKFISDQTYFGNLSNDCCSLSDFIANLSVFEDSFLVPNKNRYIKYDDTTDSLGLYEGNPLAIFHNPRNDKLICSIKDKNQLNNIIKKYYFDEILSNIDIIHSKYGIDYGEYCLMGDVDDIDEKDYYKSLDVYCNEIKKLIKTL